jgi:hypothetical protein
MNLLIQASPGSRFSFTPTPGGAKNRSPVKPKSINSTLFMIPDCHFFKKKSAGILKQIRLAGC